ncbi:MAG: antibiotic biosynthesis monooxygenase [Cyanobacteria bacterium CRU_2_1]|nr:antibiotic biosynthesis monooxygenase [Cyanobacteria bacterium CRU_2_1]
MAALPFPVFGINPIISRGFHVKFTTDITINNSCPHQGKTWVRSTNAAGFNQSTCSTRAESGCITFDLLKDTNDPTVFVLYENWKNRAALDAHFQQPYVKRVLQAYEETLAEPIEVLSLAKIEPS